MASEFDDLVDACLCLFHGEQSWHVTIPAPMAEAAIQEQRRKMAVVIRTAQGAQQMPPLRKERLAESLLSEEIAYRNGARRASLTILSTVLGHLPSAEMDHARLVKEREEAVSMLRRVCWLHGDNQWADNLDLADVIEKHLWRHLETGEQEPTT